MRLLVLKFPFKNFRTLPKFQTFSVFISFFSVEKTIDEVKGLYNKINSFIPTKGP